MEKAISQSIDLSPNSRIFLKMGREMPRFIEHSDDGEEWQIALNGGKTKLYVRTVADQESAERRYKTENPDS